MDFFFFEKRIMHLPKSNQIVVHQFVSALHQFASVSGCAINEQMVLEYVGLKYYSTSTRASGARVPSGIF